MNNNTTRSGALIIAGLLSVLSGCGSETGESTDSEDTTIVDSASESANDSTNTVDTESDDTAADPPDTGTDTGTDALPVPFIIGCYPDWKTGAFPLDAVRWSQLTHIRYSFAVPKSDGSVYFSSPSAAAAFVTRAHAEGVEAILAIGGAAGSEAFADISVSDSLLESFVANVDNAVSTYGFDAVVIDWEYWPTGEQPDPVLDQGLVHLMGALRSNLEPQNISLGMDLIASDWFGKHYLDEAVAHADVLNVMTIDGAGAWSAGPESASDMNKVRAGLAYWRGRLGTDSRARIQITVPFYGYEFDNDFVSQAADKVRPRFYKDILAAYPEAADQDIIQTPTSTIFLDSPVLMADKARFASEEGLDGIVIWELSMDTPVEEQSLLTALNDALY